VEARFPFGRPFSVVLIDLDKFKEVNDSLGHLEGDLVLARVGRLLEQKCRQSNVVARYGGDEFIILMPRPASSRHKFWPRDCGSGSPRSHARRAPNHRQFRRRQFPVHGFSMEDLIRVADAGMYVAKHAVATRFPPPMLSATVPTCAASGLRYIDGFLQREHNGPEDLEELVSTLRKLCGGQDDADRKAMKEGVEALARGRTPGAQRYWTWRAMCPLCWDDARGLNLSAEEVESVASRDGCMTWQALHPEQI